MKHCIPILKPSDYFESNFGHIRVSRENLPSTSLGSASALTTEYSPSKYQQKYINNYVI